MACHLSINFKTWTGMKDAAGGREITRPALTGYQDFVKTTQSGMCGSHSGAEQWKCLQPVLEDYCISHKVGYITGDAITMALMMSSAAYSVNSSGSKASPGTQSISKSVDTAILSTSAYTPFFSWIIQRLCLRPVSRLRR
jgi:hypothetical protein